MCCVSCAVELMCNGGAFILAGAESFICCPDDDVFIRYVRLLLWDMVTLCSQRANEVNT